MILEGVENIEKFIKENNIKHFSAKEFVCPCCRQVKIDTQLLINLEILREEIEKPIKITSAYRCPKHNKEVGGHPNSYHTQGKAVDIYCFTSRDRYKILDVIFKKSLFNRIGIGNNFIHVDIGETPKDVIWTYYGK